MLPSHIYMCTQARICSISHPQTFSVCHTHTHTQIHIIQFSFSSHTHFHTHTLPTHIFFLTNAQSPICLVLSFTVTIIHKTRQFKLRDGKWAFLHKFEKYKVNKVLPLKRYHIIIRKRRIYHLLIIYNTHTHLHSPQIMTRHSV